MVSSVRLTKKTLASLIIGLCLISGLVLLFFTVSSGPGKDAQTKPATEHVSINTSFIDTSVNPSASLYQFGNGRWLAAPDSPENTYLNKIARLMEKFNAEKAAGRLTENQEKMYSFYRSGMDAEDLEFNNISAIAFLLENVSKIRTNDDVQTVSVELTTYGVNPFFSITADLDREDPRNYTGFFALPESEFPKEAFLEKNKNTKGFESGYKEYISFCLKHAGYPDEEINKQIDSVYEIEKSLKKTTTGNFRKIALSALDEKQIARYGKPVFHWNNIPEQVGNNNITSLVFSNDNEIMTIEKVFAANSPENLKAYLAFRTIATYSPYLGGNYYHEYGKVLSYVGKKTKPWKSYVLGEQDTRIPDIVTEEFNNAYVSDDMVEDTTTIASNVKQDISTKLITTPEFQKRGEQPWFKKFKTSQFMLPAQKNTWIIQVFRLMTNRS
jgi:predicted metalloendopeptidase